MSAIITYSIRVDKLPKEKFIAGKDGAVYVNLTMSVNDETRYGNNTSIYVSQTQEEREAKKQKTYIGNGKVVWNNGSIVNAERENQEQVVESNTTETADLPF
jgi:PBP1b-binding outer membrane lipoprotein LpoB